MLWPWKRGSLLPDDGSVVGAFSGRRPWLLLLRRDDGNEDDNRRCSC